MNERKPRRPLHELDDIEAVQWLWQRGRRAALLGLLIAMGVVAAIGSALAVLLNRLIDTGGAFTGSEVAGVVVRTVGIVALGPAIGLMLTNVSFTERLTALTGSGSEGKRIRRAVQRRPAEPLTGPELERAARYAPLAAAAARFQVVFFAVFYFALVSQQVAQLLQPPGDDGFDLRPVNVTLTAAVLLTYCVMLPLQLRAAARATRYARDHSRDRAAARAEQQ